MKIGVFALAFCLSGWALAQTPAKPPDAAPAPAAKVDQAAAKQAAAAKKAEDAKLAKEAKKAEAAKKAADAKLAKEAKKAEAAKKAADAKAAKEAKKAAAAAPKAAPAPEPAKVVEPAKVAAEPAKPAPEPAKAAATPAKAAAKYTLVAVAAPDKKSERLWKAKCGSCHGEDGKGGTEKGREMKISDLSAAAWQTGRGDDEIKTSILKGTSTVKDGVKQEMDAFETAVSAEQLDSLVRYVRYLGAPR